MFLGDVIFDKRFLMSIKRLFEYKSTVKCLIRGQSCVIPT